MPQPWAIPTPIDCQERLPETIRGTLVGESVPSPNLPDTFDPQHHADPSAVIAQDALNVAVMNSKVRSVRTRTGRCWLSAEPWPLLALPRAPTSPDPQQ